MVRSETGEFGGHGGRVFWRAWLPGEPARGVIALSHGVAEHSGRYEHVGNRLADNGFAVYALDHIGHGRSAGSKANIGSIDAAADNLASLLEHASQRQPGVPRFVLGHSMGSLITLYLATRGPLEVAGVAISAPPLDIPAVPALQRLFAPLLSRWAPNLGVLQLDSSMISRDPEVVRAYDSDPLTYRGKLPARTGAEILRATEAVRTHLDRLTATTLVLHGTADALAAPSSADTIEKQAGAKDLTVIRYPGLYHEVFNEPEQDRVLTDLTDWLDKHLTPAPR